MLKHNNHYCRMKYKIKLELINAHPSIWGGTPPLIRGLWWWVSHRGVGGTPPLFFLYAGERGGQHFSTKNPTDAGGPNQSQIRNK